MIYLMIIAILLVLSVIDQKSRMVPEGASLLAILIGLNWHAHTGTANASILGLTAGVLGVWLVSQIPLARLGGGDAKVISMVGAWLGWQTALITLALSIAIYKTFFNHRKQMAFVPLILEAFVIVSIGTLVCQLVKLF